MGRSFIREGVYAAIETIPLDDEATQPFAISLTRKTAQTVVSQGLALFPSLLLQKPGY